jgi:hypothetical protein
MISRIALKRIGLIVLASSVCWRITWGYTDPYADPCHYCDCADVDGVLIANSVPGQGFSFTGGAWYYVRNADGTAGPPTRNGARKLFYNPNLHTTSCINTNNTTQTQVTILRFDVTGPTMCAPPTGSLFVRKHEISSKRERSNFGRV